MADIGFGGASNLSGFSEGAIYSDGFSLTSGNLMLNGTRSIIVSAVNVIASGRGGSRTIAVAFGSARASYTTGATSQAQGSGWLATDWHAPGGLGNVRLTIDGGGSVFFGRGGGGTVRSPYGTWDGTLGGGYRWVGAPSVPQNLTAWADPNVAGRFSFNFGGSADDGGAGVTGYTIQWGTDPNWQVAQSKTLRSNEGAGFIDGLIQNARYYVRVLAHNAVTAREGSASMPSNIASFDSKGGISAPRNAAVYQDSGTAGRLNLFWDAPASGSPSLYGIIYNNQQIATTTNRSYTFNNLTPFSNYSFAVVAYNSWSQANGQMSPWSNVTTAQPGGPTSAPRELASSRHPTEAGRLDLSWLAPTSGGPVSTYAVYINNNYYASVSGTSAVIGGLNVNQTYSFYVMAYNAWSSANNQGSAPSNSAAQAAPGGASAPRSLTASWHTTVAGRITLNWAEPSQTAGGVTRYYIYRNGVHSYNSTTTSIVLDGQTIGTTYTYEVRARNAWQDANGQISDPSNQFGIIARGQPSGVRNTTAVASTTTVGQVDVNWQVPVVTGVNFTRYNIYVDGSLWGTNTQPYLSVTGLNPGQQYRFDVRARNEWTDANGTVSDYGQDVYATPGGYPSAPLNLTAVNDAMVAGKISLSWSAPASTFGAITGYTIYYSTGVLLAKTTSTATTYTVTGLVPGQQYGFFVRARNALADVNNTAGPQSSTASTQALGQPGAPATLSVSPSTAVIGRLILTWGAASGGANGYNVYNTANVLLMHVIGLTATIDNLALGQAHGFYIKATNVVTDQAGTDGPASATVYGTPSSTTTQDVPGIAATALTNETSKSLIGNRTVTGISANTLTFSVSGVFNSLYPTQFDIATGNALQGTANNITNTTLNGTYVVNYVSATQFSYARAFSGSIPSLPVVSGTLTNQTNQTFNGTYTITVVNGATNEISYVRVASNISSRAIGVGTATNLSNAEFNGTNLPILAITPTTVQYAQAGSDIAESRAFGTITDDTNVDVYNGTYTVLSVDSYDSFSYRKTSGNRANTQVPYGVAIVIRTNSKGLLTIRYRSGWAG